MVVGIGGKGRGGKGRGGKGKDRTVRVWKLGEVNDMRRP